MSFYAAASIGVIGLMYIMLKYADDLEVTETLSTNLMMGLKLLIRTVALALGLPLLGLLARFAATDLPLTTLNEVFATLYLAYFWFIIALMFLLFIYYVIIGPLQVKEVREAVLQQRKKDL